MTSVVIYQSGQTQEGKITSDLVYKGSLDTDGKAEGKYIIGENAIFVEHTGEPHVAHVSVMDSAEVKLSDLSDINLRVPVFPGEMKEISVGRTVFAFVHKER